MKNKYYLIIVAIFTGALFMSVMNVDDLNALLSVNDDTVRIRVAQWNIGKLNLGKPGKTSITKDIRETKVADYSSFINDVQADIFFFNEFAPFFSLKDSINEDKEDLTRNAILSKYKECHYGPRYGANCNCIATNLSKLDSIKVVDYTKKDQHRYYLSSDIVVRGIKIKVVSTHLDYKDERSSQIEELLETFAYDDYVIICGDFNIKKLAEFDIFKSKGYEVANHGFAGNLITHRTTNSAGYFDNIITKGLDIANVTVYKTALSDHYAIASDLVLHLK